MKFFTQRREALALLPRAVGAPSLEVPGAMDGALGRNWNWMILEVPSDPCHFVIPEAEGWAAFQLLRNKLPP